MDCTLFDIDNPFSYLSYLDATEESQDEKVEQMVDFLLDNYDEPIPAEKVSDAIYSFGIDYMSLPQHLLDYIDTIEVM